MDSNVHHTHANENEKKEKLWRQTNRKDSKNEAKEKKRGTPKGKGEVRGAGESMIIVMDVLISPLTLEIELLDSVCVAQCWTCSIPYARIKRSQAMAILSAILGNIRKLSPVILYGDRGRQKQKLFCATAWLDFISVLYFTSRVESSAMNIRESFNQAISYGVCSRFSLKIPSNLGRFSTWLSKGLQSSSKPHITNDIIDIQVKCKWDDAQDVLRKEKEWIWMLVSQKTEQSWKKNRWAVLGTQSEEKAAFHIGRVVCTKDWCAVGRETFLPVAKDSKLTKLRLGRECISLDSEYKDNSCTQCCWATRVRDWLWARKKKKKRNKKECELKCSEKVVKTIQSKDLTVGRATRLGISVNQQWEEGQEPEKTPTRRAE